MGSWKKIKKAGSRVADAGASIATTAANFVSIGDTYVTEIKDEISIECAADLRKKVRKLIKKHGIDEARKIIKLASKYDKKQSIIQEVFDDLIQEKVEETK